MTSEFTRGINSNSNIKTDDNSLFPPPLHYRLSYKLPLNVYNSEAKKNKRFQSTLKAISIHKINKYLFHCDLQKWNLCETRFEISHFKKTAFTPLSNSVTGTALSLIWLKNPFLGDKKLFLENQKYKLES